MTSSGVKVGMTASRFESGPPNKPKSHNSEGKALARGEYRREGLKTVGMLGNTASQQGVYLERRTDQGVTAGETAKNLTNWAAAW